jgi:hypothetical protein
MKIVLMHFHLKIGGVSTVIRQQINCLKEWAQVLVITGEPAPTDFPAETIHIPDIAYDRIVKAHGNPQSTARSIQNAIRSKFPQGCDMIHVHNPLLAKNRSYLKILKALQAMGFRLFLQIHDFAEDGRPDAYYSETYPHKCCYGVINSRDYRIMLKAGIDQAALFKLFNMINPIEARSSTFSVPKHILYPVRAIRRKNIGEAILLSLFLTEKAQLAITLPPNSPPDQSAYAEWKRFTVEHGLDVAFEMGLQYDFATLMHTADFILTTSITEGFGFCFLEPWVAGKYLMGRLLPEICHDFKLAGVNLDHLYEKLAIPVEWIGENTLFKKWSYALHAAAARFHYHFSIGNLRKSFDQIIADHTIDFGLLDETFQKRIIERILTNPSAAKVLLELNPYLADLSLPENAPNLILENRNAILTAYSRKAYIKLLKQTYQSVAAREPNHFQVNQETLLSSFLTPKNASLLKWSPYAPCESR